MAYHTAVYLFLFLPLVLLAYQLIAEKLRWMVLLLAGYLFFWMISGQLVIFLIGTSLWIYGMGLWLDRLQARCRLEETQTEEDGRRGVRKNFKKREKRVLAVGVLLPLAILAYLKYDHFFV